MSKPIWFLAATISLGLWNNEGCLTGAFAGMSHAPLRELPAIADRPMGAGTHYFLDPVHGDDSAAGKETAPWRTINYALKQVQAGDTICLRAGIYREQVYCAVAGRPDAPITLRAYPGERAIIDGGIAEFFDEPANAWMPEEQGAPGEYRSAKAFKNIRDVVGLFGDSHIGLQTYWHLSDLRAANELWTDDSARQQMVLPVYCGPGLWFDRETGHIHARLAHTHLTRPPVDNYRGETDPRKLPLIIAPFNSLPLKVDMAQHVRFQDLVIRGGGHDCVVMQMGIGVEFDNVTIFAGTYGVRSRSTGPLRMVETSPISVKELPSTGPRRRIRVATSGGATAFWRTAAIYWASRICIFTTTRSSPRTAAAASPGEPGPPRIRAIAAPSSTICSST